MRNLIIGLSVILFTLSGIVLFRALNIPVKESQQQENREGSKTRAQAANQSVVHELQAASASLEDKGPYEYAVSLANDKTSGNKSRILAVIGDGDFNSGQILIDYSLKNTIKKLVPDILSSPDYRVHVEGHTDDMPIKVSSDKQYVNNTELSFLRAKAVASILVENGVPLNRISITGYGETRPIVSNETDEGRIKNRRVEIKLIPEDKEF